MFVLGSDAPIEKRRAAMDRVGRFPKPRGCNFESTTIGGVPAVFATPTGAVRGRHILYLHGGGYSIGSSRSHAGMAARLAAKAHAVAVVIDYRLAPEHRYPAAIDDCVAAYRALLALTDSSQIVIAGDSAGGGAALATLVSLRDAGDPLPGGTYLISPWTDLTASGESITTKAEIEPMIELDHLRESVDDYIGDLPPDHPGVSPLFADLSDLPPMLIQVGSDEVLLDDSTRLAERAEARGIDVTIEIGQDLWHVYQALAGFMPEADAAFDRAAEFIRLRTA